jgi:hypothetical protein
MTRLLCALVLCTASSARADLRLDLGAIPELTLYDDIYGHDEEASRDRGAWHGSLGTGAGDEGAAGAGALRANLGVPDAHVGVAAEWVATQEALTRAYVRMLAGVRLGDSDDVGIRIELEPRVDVGRSTGVAPIAAGSGRRVLLDYRGRATIALSEEQNDRVWVAAVEADAWAVSLHELDLRSNRVGLGLALGRAGTDRRFRRGTFDLVRGRVAHGEIGRRERTTGREVRIAEVGLGPKQLTVYSERGWIGVVDLDLGWSWLEVGGLVDDMFRLRAGGSVAKLVGDDRHRVGLAVAREPTYRVDGRQLVSEWRAALSAVKERRRYVIEAAGAISWGSVTTEDPLLRYGAQLELYRKLPHGLELGAYHAAWFEPPPSRDPWSVPRRWTAESGVALRFRRR